VDGGSFTATVSVAGGCAWTASAPAWLSVSPSSGSGTTTLTVKVAANSGASRNGTLQVENRTVRVSQAGCQITLSPTSRSIGFEGAQSSVNVRTGVACPWKPGATVGWINQLSGAGPGSKDVTFTVQRNDGAARTGRVEIGSTAVSVSQDAPPAQAPTCSFTVGPTTANVPRAGGTIVVQVRTSSGCGWVVAQPREQSSWVSFDPMKGGGPGEVRVVVAENATRKPRTAKIEIAGQGVSLPQSAD
jgi:hypothetical protein